MILGNARPNGHITPCEECPLRRVPCLREFSPEELEFVKRFKIDELHVEPGASFLTEGTRSEHLYTILEGWAFRYKVLDDGRRQILNFALPADMVGLQGAVMEEMEHSVEALTPLTLCILPITFGYKIATVLAGFERHRERLKQLKARVLVGEFGGAAGTLSSLGKDGLKCQAELMKELKLTPPAKADAGKPVAFTVSAKGDGEALQLPLQVTPSRTEPARLTLEPKLPALRGTAKSAFDFQVDIDNEGQQDTTVNLLSKAPDGFQVTFKEGYGSQELTSLPIKAGESKDLKIAVQPPDSAQAGQYPVAVAAAAGDISADTNLVLDITGRPSVSLSGPEGRLSGDATAGQERTFTFTLDNTGSAPARDVALSATPPSGWKVAFNPEKVDDIEPGQDASVAVSMTPSQQAIAGDYMVSVRANGSGVSDSANFRVTVRTSTLWGVTGLAIIGIAVLVLGFAVARYGRR